MLRRIFPRSLSRYNDGFEGINMGDGVRDTISGFRGVVLARTEHATGCNQVFVLPESESTSKVPEGAWFDVERIEVMEPQVLQVRSRPGGADIPKPVVEGKR